MNKTKKWLCPVLLIVGLAVVVVGIIMKNWIMIIAGAIVLVAGLIVCAAKKVDKDSQIDTKSEESALVESEDKPSVPEVEVEDEIIADEIEVESEVSVEIPADEPKQAEGMETPGEQEEIADEENKPEQV